MAKKEYPYPDFLYKELWEQLKEDLREWGKTYGKRDSERAARLAQYYRSTFGDMARREKQAKLNYVYNRVVKENAMSNGSDVLL